MNKMKALEYKKAEEILANYDIPLCPGKLVLEEKEALAFAQKTGYPLVVKLLSPLALHKTDLGLVITGIRNKKELIEVWQELAARKIKKEGILIQKQLSGIEIVVGMKRDCQFGPVLMFGLGGILVEVLQDVSFRIAPIKEKEAVEMIKETKAYKLISGFRGKKPVDVKKISKLLISLSELSLKENYIREIDFNPVIVNSQGVWVADPRFLI